MRLHTAVGVHAAFLFAAAAQAQLGVPGAMGSGTGAEGVGGAQPLRITGSPAFESYPAWSPDGSRIAFARYEGGVQKIFVVEVGEDEAGGLVVGEERQVTRGEGVDARPAWVIGAAGDELVFCTNRSGYWQLYRVLVDGAIESGEAEGEPLKQTTAGWNPAWSGNASRLAFVSGHDIFTAGLDGGDRQMLATMTGHNDWPAWSPDGRSLVYTGNNDLWVSEVPIGLGAGKSLPLTRKAWNGHASWTARGDRIAFVSSRGASYDIWITAASGMEEPVQATFDPAREAFPSWSRDGKWICYASDRTSGGSGRGGFDIWAVQVPVLMTPEGPGGTPGGQP